MTEARDAGEQQADDPKTCPVCDRVTHGNKCGGCGFDPKTKSSGEVAYADVIRQRIRAWQEDDKAGYDQAIALLCDADEFLGEAQRELATIRAEHDRLRAAWQQAEESDSRNFKARIAAELRAENAESSVQALRQALEETENDIRRLHTNASRIEHNRTRDTRNAGDLAGEGDCV